MRIQACQSISVGKEGAYADAGLAFGRSFRVSWGPGGLLTRIEGPSRFVLYSSLYHFIYERSSY